MGIYLNPGNKSFQQSVRSKIYVDKTNLIACTNERLNTKDKYICVSRPRRFGKSMALEMLAAYYSRGCDSKELFAAFKIAQSKTFADHLNRYDVIYLNMQQFLIESDSSQITGYLEQEVLRELRKTSVKRPALCCACLYDRDSSCKKVRTALRIEYVLGIFHD